MKAKAVFHVDQDAADILNLALTNISNVLVQIPPDECRIDLVANGPAVKLLAPDRIEPFADKMKHLAGQGVRFKACRNALKAMGIDPESLPAYWIVVPAGVVEIVQLQSEGFAYIKP